MKRAIHFLCIAACLFIASLTTGNAQVLPAGMHVLTPDGVVVTTTGTTETTENVNKSEKPMVTTGNGLLFFTASTLASGDELWVTDGTPAGTKMVKDLRAGAEGSDPRWLCAVGRKVFFSASAEDNIGRELYVSDGTEAGTKLVKNIYVDAGKSSAPECLTAFGDTLVFVAMNDESEYDPTINPDIPEKWLWMSDGTEEGTKYVYAVNVITKPDGMHGNMVKMGGKIFFVGDDGQAGEELWITDGTPTGTVMLKDINPGKGSAAIAWMFNVSDYKLLFRALTVKEVTGADYDYGNEIWISDGTTEGTKWIGVDFAPGEVNGVPNQTQYAYPIIKDSFVYFRADDITHGVEPCRTKLTKATTEHFSDINNWNGSSTLPSWPQPFFVFDRYIYTCANGGYYNSSSILTASGHELWRSDGLSPFTIFYDMVPGGNGTGDAYVKWPVQVDNKMYFAANDAPNASENREVWGLANSDSVPVKVLDLPDNGRPYSLKCLRDTLLIFATESDTKLYAYRPSLRSGKPNDLTESIFIVTLTEDDDDPVTGIVSLRASEDVDFTVFPNPAKQDGMLTIKCDVEAKAVAVYSLAGVKLFTSPVNSAGFKLGNVRRGVYIIKVEFGNGRTAGQKIVVE